VRASHALSALALAALATTAAATAATRPHEGGARARGAAAPRAAVVLSADARLSRGASRVLLRVPRLGRFVASCSNERRVAVAFVADHRLPTADLVVALSAGPPLARRLDPDERVTPEAPAAVLMERWQVAPFAAAGVRVSVANVAGRTVGNGCAASVLVTTGPDQGPTIT